MPPVRQVRDLPDQGHQSGLTRHQIRVEPLVGTGLRRTGSRHREASRVDRYHLHRRARCRHGHRRDPREAAGRTPRTARHLRPPVLSAPSSRVCWSCAGSWTGPGRPSSPRVTELNAVSTVWPVCQRPTQGHLQGLAQGQPRPRRHHPHRPGRPRPVPARARPHHLNEDYELSQDVTEKGSLTPCASDVSARHASNRARPGRRAAPFPKNGTG